MWKSLPLKMQMMVIRHITNHNNLFWFYRYTIREHCDGPDVCFVLVLALVAGGSCSLSAQQTHDSVSANRTTYQLSLFERVLYISVHGNAPIGPPDCGTAVYCLIVAT